MTPPMSSETHEGGIQVMYAPLGHAQVTVAGAAVILPSLPAIWRVRRATIRTLLQPINWRDDGVDPTNTVGMFLDKGETLIYDGDMTLFKMITDASATGSADVRVAYHGV